MSITYYDKTSLTGGGGSSLDGIDGDGLLDNDKAFVNYNGAHYDYVLDADSGAAESIPNIIAPDINPGNKRWLLQEVRAKNMVTTNGVAYTFPSTSATIARTDAAQTFTGDQTFSGSVITSTVKPASTGTLSLTDHDGAGITVLHGGNVGIGTTDLDGTPATGRLTVKGSTNDGSTNIFVGRDSDEANQITIDTNGNITASGTINGITFASAATGFSASGGTSSKSLVVDADSSITGERLAQTENVTETIFYPAISGDIVDTASAQTLTNKTFTTPKINEAVNLSATSTQLDDAVSKKHTQNTDTGTTATSFVINSGGNEADLRTTGLTTDRDYTFPDIDTMLAGSVMMTQNTFEIIAY